MIPSESDPYVRAIREIDQAIRGLEDDCVDWADVQRLERFRAVREAMRRYHETIGRRPYVREMEGIVGRIMEGRRVCFYHGDMQVMESYPGPFLWSVGRWQTEGFPLDGVDLNGVSLREYLTSCGVTCAWYPDRYGLYLINQRRGRVTEVRLPQGDTYVFLRRIGWLWNEVNDPDAALVLRDVVTDDTVYDLKGELDKLQGALVRWLANELA